MAFRFPPGFRAQVGMADADPVEEVGENEAEEEEDTLASRRSRRSNKNDKNSRLSALELLKKCKAEGKKHAFEVGEIDNIYEEVTEEEYSSRVQSRIETNFVIGSGYDDDGREIFDEDYDYNSDDERRPDDRKPIKKRKADGEKGDQEGGTTKKKMKCIDDVFRSMGNNTKVKEAKVKIEEDDILGDILKELTPASSSVPEKPSSKSSSSLRLLETSKNNWGKDGASLLNKPTTSAFINPKSHSRLNKFAVSSKPEVPDSSDHHAKSSSQEMPSHTQFYTPPECTADQEEEETVEMKEENGDSAIIESIDFDDDDDLQDPNVDVQPEIQTKNKEEKEEAFDDGINWASVFSECLDDTESPSSQAVGSQCINFYWLDAYEDTFKSPDSIFLFGKVLCPKTNKLVSCCLKVNNLERIIFLLPREFHKSDPSKSVTPKDLYVEFDKMAGKLKILKFKSRMVNKKYCFEISDVPVESDYLEVRYSAKFPEISQIEGDTFCKIFGAKTSALENLLLYKKIYGPCWLQAKCSIDLSPLSWCEMNFVCDGMNSIKVVEKTLPAPSVIAVSISTCVSFNSQSNTNEVVGVAVLVNKCLSLTNTAIPVSNTKGGKACQPKIWHEHLFGISKPKDSIFPYNFEKNIASKIKNVTVFPSEKSLLNWLVCKIKLIDPDVLIGHDLMSFQLDLLVSRLMYHKVPHWSRISRLKRTHPPKSMNGHVIPSLTAGRLICDITISAKELVRCRGYSLTDLSLQILHEDRQQIDYAEVPNFYSTNDSLMQLIAVTLNDASYCFRIANELQSIPLAIQITTIAGNVASRTFAGGRAERNEFLLLHAFHEKGYVVPDKSFKKGQQQQHFIEQELTNLTQGDEENQQPGSNEGGEARKRKAAYAGGLVLEPKKGFYNTCILLLDFNSLYPSIMQEYNICYTTVNRAHCYEAEAKASADQIEEQILPDIPDVGLQVGILPTEIRKLVDKRKQVKVLLKTPNLTAELKAQYDIRQKALKLTANSMYGCLGFPNSRFYAKPLAALITAKGREILMKTKELVEGMGHDVIYGDTDSIMVNSNMENMDEVFKIGNKVKSEVNKYYKTLEIDIDGVYKSLLLLKKKKYAALAVTALPNGEYKYEKELKGLDIVRRDWSVLARDAGEFVIGEILSNKAREDIVCNIQQYLTDLASSIENGKVELEKFIIRKTLNKAPEAYPDKRSLPHVQVAARLNSRGGKKLQGGDTVPYVVCKDGTEASATQRGYHPDEIEKSGGKLVLDTQYYYSQQLHPVISRICEPIDEISSASIAQCLGLDPAQYAAREQTTITEADEPDLQTRFQHCIPFQFKCPKCKFQMTVSNAFDETNSFLSLFQCLKCHYTLAESYGPIINSLNMQLRQFIANYYANVYKCEDCDFKTRSIPFKFVGKHPLCPQCKKQAMTREVSESDLYNQLTYLAYVFDPARALQNMPEENKMKANLAMRNGAASKSLYHLLKDSVDKVLKQSAFSSVNMSQLFRPLTTINYTL